MSKKRILISENSKDFVQLLVQFLSSQADIEIVGVAYDGKRTLEMISQTKPDVLLLDIIMPEMDGLSVLKKINELQDKPRVFIITALGLETIKEMTKGYAVENYFVKPVNLYGLYKAI